MSMFDWDGDGKNTFADDYIEYQIYKETMEEKELDDETHDFIPPTPPQSPPRYTYHPVTTKESEKKESENEEEPPLSSGMQLAVILLVNVIIFGGMYLGVKIGSESGNGFVMMLFWLVAGAIGIGILYITGLFKPGKK